ncbi:MAG: hypothetical protein AABW65_00745 [Nanoarchaeota archaeon]
MEGVYTQDNFTLEINTRIRDIEEKQRLLKDRVTLLGQTFTKEREKNFSEIQQTKKYIIQIKEENSRIQEILQRVIELLGNVARKEELMIIQRQLDLFRQK